MSYELFHMDGSFQVSSYLMMFICGCVGMVGGRRRDRNPGGAYSLFHGFFWTTELVDDHLSRVL